MVLVVYVSHIMCTCFAYCAHTAGVYLPWLQRKTAEGCIFWGCSSPFSSQSRLVLCATRRAMPIYATTPLSQPHIRVSSSSSSSQGQPKVPLAGSFLRRKLLQSNTELAALLMLWYFTSRTSFWPCPAKLLLTSAHNKTLCAKVSG